MMLLLCFWKARAKHDLFVGTHNDNGSEKPPSLDAMQCSATHRTAKHAMRCSPNPCYETPMPFHGMGIFGPDPLSHQLLWEIKILERVVRLCVCVNVPTCIVQSLKGFLGSA